MFPQIPADLNSLDAAALRALAKEIKAVALANLKNVALSTEDRATTMDALTKRDEVIALADAKDAEAAQAKADADRIAKLESDNSDDPAPADPDGDPDADPDADPDGEASAKPKLPVTTGAPSLSGAPSKPVGVKLIEQLIASDGVSGKRAGEGFESWTALAAAMIDRSANINANTSEKFNVAVVKANYPENRKLSDNKALNLALFEPDEMTAALCAPATPYYGLKCMNSTRRPVFNSLSQFEAPRMKVSIMPSPALSDITTGVGVWSAANEASTNATKSACQTITCGNPTEYQVYGVYRCLTVRNMLAMSYPELVEAWLNRLSAAHARLAEIQLLNAMGTAATAINAPSLGYGATQALVSTLLNYLGLYQETQRWDITENLDIWLHRWVMQAMKTDLFRRRSITGLPNKVATDAEINAMFTNAGFNPHWFIDTPTWSPTVPPVATGNTLNRFPVDISVLIAPPGKYGLMDRGELRIGVTGNGIYRDNNSNNRNEFTFFFENFEGIVDTQNCGAHVLTLPANCYSGVQIDDIVLNCQGGDEVGTQS